MITVYIDSDQQEWWLEQALGQQLINYQIYRNINDWLSEDLSDSLAMVEILCENDLVAKQVEALCKRAKRVLIFIPELIDQTWLEKFDYSNVTIVVAGIVNTIQET